MPWRDDTDPYRIWVSEIMLQQTRVETVVDYYPRFLARFPTLRALAAAAPDDVLKVWEGLGYYSRARNLHRAARIVKKRFCGRIPDDFDALASLPGIGRSTAGAILSIAFGRPFPVLDGNVRRVLVRLSGIAEDPARPAVQAVLWTTAEAGCAGVRDAGLHTQAMMELGATVCTPRSPRCPDCPVAAGCAAFRSGDPGALPVRAARRAIPHHDVAVGLLRDRGRLFVQRRPDGGMLGGLWELPGGKIRVGETPEEGLRRELREELGIDARVGTRVAVVRHAYTHFTITLHAYRCRRLGGRLRPEAPVCRWVTPAEMDALAVPRATRRVLEAIEGEGPGRAAGAEGRNRASTPGAPGRMNVRRPPAGQAERGRARAVQGAKATRRATETLGSMPCPVMRTSFRSNGPGGPGAAKDDTIEPARGRNRRRGALSRHRCPQGALVVGGRVSVGPGRRG